MNTKRIVIVGAGPTGLGAAYRLKELGHDNFVVIDGLSHVGGLARSFVDKHGFTWDIGGHVQFSHYKYFDELMVKALGNKWLHHERESWVWIENRFIPYPFQNNIRHLNKDSMWKCLKGLIDLYKNPQLTKPKNFKEWILSTFGVGLSEIFMLPYNFKVWAYPPELMDHSWVGERVAITDLERVLKNCLDGNDDISWGPNNTFQFPEKGGTGAIWEAVADLVGRDRILLNTEVKNIDPVSKSIFINDDIAIPYDTIISSIPIDRLTVLADFKHLTTIANELKYSSSHIYGVGMSGKPHESLKKKCWMYFPESDCPFYRVTVFSNYSPNNVPDSNSQWSLMAEVSESRFKPVNTKSLFDDVIQGMIKTNLIDNTDSIISKWSLSAKYGYPTPSIGRDEILNQIHPELERNHIYSRGRFGGWKYEVSNQDHSLMQGVELVNRLLLGVPEVTYRFPNTANDLRFAKN